MSSKLPTTCLRRAQLSPQTCSTSHTHQQIRHASLIKRPHRPYTFTQLVTLSDGSTYTHRTTSPAPIFRSTKDTRNHPMWQPSLDSLRNVEQDDAGRLRAFREKFGRGWDVDGGEEVEATDGGEGGEGRVMVDGKAENEDDGVSMMDMIAGRTKESKAEAKARSGMEELMAAVEKESKGKGGGKKAKKGGKK